MSRTFPTGSGHHQHQGLRPPCARSALFALRGQRRSERSYQPIGGQPPNHLKIQKPLPYSDGQLQNAHCCTPAGGTGGGPMSCRIQGGRLAAGSRAPDHPAWRPRKGLGLRSGRSGWRPRVAEPAQSCACAAAGRGSGSAAQELVMFAGGDWFEQSCRWSCPAPGWLGAEVGRLGRSADAKPSAAGAGGSLLEVAP